jgi:hypothetical protein
MPSEINDGTTFQTPGCALRRCQLQALLDRTFIPEWQEPSRVGSLSSVWLESLASSYGIGHDGDALYAARTH